MRDCRGELLGRVRRGLASDQERTAFEAHLYSCESCLMTLDVMGDFDAVGEAEPGDSERVARMGATAAGSRGAAPPTPLRPARRAWLLAVAALVLTGAAVAGGVGWVALRSQPESPVKNASPTPAPTDKAPVLAPAPASTVATVAGGAAAGALFAERAVATASEVYRAANDARRAGRTDAAIQAYQRLQRFFPGSAEAQASRVSLGGLLLRSGSASAALAQFDAYLQRGGGRLAAEALFGRGRALQALGRSADEAENLERLLTQYPDSAYATHAQRRLDQLR